jgi:hypothetical protein
MPKAGKSNSYCTCSCLTCFHFCYCILATCIVFSIFLHQRAGIAWVFGFCFLYALTEVFFGNRKELFLIRTCSLLFPFLLDLLFRCFLLVFCMIGGLPCSRPDYC